MTSPRLTVLALAALAILLLTASCASPAAGSFSSSPSGPAGLERAESLQQTPEEQLATKYAPIVYLGRQDAECDGGGDPFDPAPVEIVLDNPEVTLREDAPGKPVVMEGPGAQDVFDKDIGFFLDFPGNPRRPGCTYDRDYQELKASNPPVAYAHIQTEPGFDGLALQYWFFYYLNDWNNRHEGDWEMIQLAFHADSASEALQQEPVRMALSQHEGGEIADWDEGKVKKEEGRPVVYVARGSHANYFQPGTYVGVARAGAGFGCEDSSDPLRRVPLEARLVPDKVSGPDDPFAWIEFGGRWGELKGKHFDGPTGPGQKGKWEKPFTWEEELRDYSEKLPEGEALGIDPLRPICAVIRAGSTVLNAFHENPVVVGAGLGFTLMTAVGMVISVPSRLLGRRPTPLEREKPGVRRGVGSLGRRAANLYVARWRLFSLIGAMFLPLGILATAVQERLGLDRVEDLVDNRAVGPFLVFTVGSLQALVAAVIVGGAVIATVGEANARGPVGVWRAYRVVFSRFWTLVGAHLRSAFHIILLAITVIGIPWAIHRTVSWAFVGQAVILDGSDAKAALSRSAEVVRGNWWRVMLILFGLAVIALLPGPIIGLAFLLFASPPVSDTVYAVNTALYALLLLPLLLTASTLVYLDLAGRPPADGTDQWS